VDSTTQGFDTILYQPQTALTSLMLQTQFRLHLMSVSLIAKSYVEHQISLLLILLLIPDADTFPMILLLYLAAEFVAGLTVPQLLSVLRQYVYSDFTTYVSTYFGYVGGFSSSFVNAEDFSYNSGIFDETAFINLLTGQLRMVLVLILTTFSGTIIGNINYLLRNAIDSNAFQ
jgi:hypothetical protein